jgi:hypothetical protein
MQASRSWRSCRSRARRRGFEAILDVPVTIRDPDKAISTHVFTAVGRSGGGLRWTAATLEGDEDAKTALDRITIPQDVLDNIAPTASPRSSLIISDKPLNRETNNRTEFVVVPNDQPQGGLAVRRPPARYGGFGGGSWGFFPIWQWAPARRPRPELLSVVTALLVKTRR